MKATEQLVTYILQMKINATVGSGMKISGAKRCWTSEEKMERNYT
jgi:hypothetical protein